VPAPPRGGLNHHLFDSPGERALQDRLAAKSTATSVPARPRDAALRTRRTAWRCMAHSTTWCASRMFLSQLFHLKPFYMCRGNDRLDTWLNDHPSKRTNGRLSRINLDILGHEVSVQGSVCSADAERVVRSLLVRAVQASLVDPQRHVASTFTSGLYNVSKCRRGRRLKGYYAPSVRRSCLARSPTEPGADLGCPDGSASAGTRMSSKRCR